MVARGRCEFPVSGGTIHLNGGCGVKDSESCCSALHEDGARPWSQAAQAWGVHPLDQLNSPGQANLDLALTKKVAVTWPIEKSTLEFRVPWRGLQQACPKSYELNNSIPKLRK